jgi:hypothetical protein
VISKGFGNLALGFSAGYGAGNYSMGVDYALIPSTEFGLVNAFGLRFSF